MRSALASPIAKKYKSLFETFDIFWKKISNPKWVKPYYFVEYQSILLVQTLTLTGVVGGVSYKPFGFGRCFGGETPKTALPHYKL
jgi:hypothetical protein